jgi:amidohydrolase
MQDIRKKATEISGLLSAIRRDIHRHPELSMQEYRTSGIVADTLEKAGIETRRGIAGTGITGTLQGNSPGRCLALRADMDALPIEEKTGAEYASINKGIMHACGHDVHTTCLLGAALILSDIRDSFSGTVKFIFQPAEEINDGAKQMIKAGVLSDPEFEAIFGLHTAPAIPAGKIGVKEGPLMAAVDTIRIVILGEGGHGAVPDRTRDAVVAASAVVQNLQTIVSRKTSPFDPVVVSIGTIHGGKANNVIADRVEMSGTVRTYNAETREKMPGLLKNIIARTCAALDTEGKLEYIFDLPPLVNDPECAGIIREAALKVLGPGSVIEATPSGGGEDFAVFLEHVKGAFFFLGTGGKYEWHHPEFDVNEDCLAAGAAVLSQTAANYLRKE